MSEKSLIKKRTGSFLLLLLCAGILACGAQLPGQEIKIEKLSGHVHLIAGRYGSMCVSIGKDGVLLVDTKVDALVDTIKEKISKLCDLPIRYVINTHWHHDHIGGNEKFHQAGAVIIAHETVRKRLQKEHRNDFFDSDYPALPPAALPIITFKKELTLHFNDDTVHVFHLQPAHTDGDALVYFRSADVLHIGDIYFASSHPTPDITSGGSIDSMIEAVNRVLPIINDSTIVVPGHGKPTDKNGLKRYAAMLGDIRDRVRTQIDAGKTLEQIIAARPTRDYDHIWKDGSLTPARFVEYLYLDLTRSRPGQAGSDTKLSGPYLGQTPPGLSPKLFAPGIISTPGTENCSAFSGDGSLFIFRRSGTPYPDIRAMERIDNHWTAPTVVPFQGPYQAADFTFAADGITLYYTSKAPLHGTGPAYKLGNIWRVTKTANGWSRPQPLGSDINTDRHESYPSVARSGTLYFFRRERTAGGDETSNIYRAAKKGSGFARPENLGAPINTDYHEWDPFIAPDESYLIFCSTKPGGFGSDDLYISFRTGGGSWSEPKNLGKEINSPGSDNRPYVTPDGKYFFFTSNKQAPPQFRSQGGSRDIYWVDAAILKKR